MRKSGHASGAQGAPAQAAERAVAGIDERTGLWSGDGRWEIGGWEFSHMTPAMYPGRHRGARRLGGDRKQPYGNTLRCGCQTPLTGRVCTPFHTLYTSHKASAVKKITSFSNHPSMHIAPRHWRSIVHIAQRRRPLPPAILASVNRKAEGEEHLAPRLDGLPQRHTGSGRCPHFLRYQPRDTPLCLSSCCGAA